MEDTRLVLPLELVLHVIDALVPAKSSQFLRPSQSAAKTLFAFAGVCRATRPLALTYLGRHCMYFDSTDRLRRLLLHLAVPAPGAPPLPPLEPMLLRNLTSMYLSPFGVSLDDYPTAFWVRELLLHVCGTLERLVVDMPLRSLHPADDRLSVRATLRTGFAALTRLVEFVSVRDELYLDTLDREWAALAGTPEEPPVWTWWPALRRMALYNVDVGTATFWRAVAGMAGLQELVLTRADGLEDRCLKAEYCAHVRDRAPARPLRVLLVNVADQQPQRLQRADWDVVDPGMRMMHVEVYDVPTSHYGDEDPIELCQEWVKRAALGGALWDWEGFLLRGAPVGSGLANPEGDADV